MVRNRWFRKKIHFLILFPKTDFYTKYISIIIYSFLLSRFFFYICGYISRHFNTTFYRFSWLNSTSLILISVLNHLNGDDDCHWNFKHIFWDVGEKTQKLSITRSSFIQCVAHSKLVIISINIWLKIWGQRSVAVHTNTFLFFSVVWQWQFNYWVLLRKILAWKKQKNKKTRE